MKKHTSLRGPRGRGGDHRRSLLHEHARAPRPSTAPKHRAVHRPGVHGPRVAGAVPASSASSPSGTATRRAPARELDALNQVLEAVKAANPDLIVNVLEVPFADIFNKCETDVATGGGPDLFIAPNDSLGFQAREGVLADLDAASSPTSSANTTEIAVDGSKVDGKLYMVPESLKAVALNYDTAKIATPPATTDELLAGVKDGSIKVGFFGPGRRITTSGGGRPSAASSWTRTASASPTPPVSRCLPVRGRPPGRPARPSYAELRRHGQRASRRATSTSSSTAPGPRRLQGRRPDLGVAPMPAGPVGPAAAADRCRRLVHQPQPRKDLDLAVDFALAMTDEAAQQIFVDVAGHIPANTEHHHHRSDHAGLLATRSPPASRARRSSSSTTSGATSATPGSSSSRPVPTRSRPSPTRAPRWTRPTASSRSSARDLERQRASHRSPAGASSRPAMPIRAPSRDPRRR